MDTFVVVISTLALAGFAGIQLLRERHRDKELRRNAQVRISAVAFLANRQLRSWLGSGSGSVDAFEDWFRPKNDAGTLSGHLDIAEARFIDLLSLAAAAEPEVLSVVRSAAVYFFTGAGRLNTYLDTPRPDDPLAIKDWIQLRDDAWRDLCECVLLLEDEKMGANVLLNEKRALDAKRAEENPSLETLYRKFGYYAEKELEQLKRKRIEPS